MKGVSAVIMATTAVTQARRSGPPLAASTSIFASGTEFDGEFLPDEVVIGMCNLQLVAGIDTTWSSIGSALWHFAGHDDDRRRLAAEPELWDTALEEMLRFYAPVTMARNAAEDVEYGGVTFKKAWTWSRGARGRDVASTAARRRVPTFGSATLRCRGGS